MNINVDVGLKERKIFTIGNFKGIDTANSSFNVIKNRAIVMKNFININGVNRKRNGWKQIELFKNVDGTAKRINGIFEFKIEQSDFRIIYADTTFYSYNYIQQIYVDITQKEDATKFVNGAKKYDVISTMLTNSIVQMFVYNEKAYFIGCGDYLVFGNFGDGFELRRVEDNSDTYIPTTTINIAAEEDVATSKVKAERLDDINMLSSYRYNTLLGTTLGSDSVVATYKLDDSIDVNSQIEVRLSKAEKNTDNKDCVVDYVLKNYVGEASIERKLIIGDNINGKTLSLKGFANNKDHTTKSVRLNHRLLTNTSNKIFWESIHSNWTSEYSKLHYISENTDTVIAQAKRFTNLVNWTITWEKEKINIKTPNDCIIVDIVGLDDILLTSSFFANSNDLIEKRDTGNVDIKWGTIDYEKGTIGFIKSTTSPYSDGTNNITVKYQKRVEGLVDRINKCTIGIIYGVEGIANRLFLSGNPEYCNLDFYTEKSNFTYFGDKNYVALGSKNSEILGYHRLPDNTLAIFKSSSKQEATLYIRSGKYNTTYDEKGRIKNQLAIFSTVGGYITQGVISKYGFGNLAGDPLIVSKNGVFGIELSSNVVSEERFSKDRSVPINKLLSKHNLSKAVSIVFDNRYYLSVDNNCYVADARYSYSSSGMTDTKNYEWWVWENMPVRVWAVINNKLCFGTKDGQICEFDDEFVDRSFNNTTSSELSLCNGGLSVNKNLKIVEKDEMIITTDLYRVFLNGDNIVCVKDNKIYVSENFKESINDGMEVFADNVSNGSLEVEKNYIIINSSAELVRVDGGIKALKCFNLSYEGKIITIASKTFRLLENIKDKKCYVKFNKDNTALLLKLFKEGENINLDKYNSTAPTGILAKINYYKNVTAEWFTPVFDLGSNIYSKSLLQMTLSTDKMLNGKLMFGFETKKASNLICSKDLNTFDFENFDFNNFTFDTAFASSYSKKIKERAFNYIMFKFKSDDDNDCAINELSIIYKINRKNKGVE